MLSRMCCASQQPMHDPTVHYPEHGPMKHCSIQGCSPRCSMLWEPVVPPSSCMRKSSSMQARARAYCSKAGRMAPSANSALPFSLRRVAASRRSSYITLLLKAAWRTRLWASVLFDRVHLQWRSSLASWMQCPWPGGHASRLGLGAVLQPNASTLSASRVLTVSE